MPHLFTPVKAPPTRMLSEITSRSWGHSGPRASLVPQTVKNLPAMRQTHILTPDWEDSLEKGTDRGAWGATVHGVTKSHERATNTHFQVKSLSHLADDLYIAGIIKEGDHYNTYGVIDIDDKTILTFEYSSIKLYGGKIPRSYWSWDDEYITEQVEIPEEVQHWLVHKNGYGLIDCNGKICIPSEYDNIQKFENGF